MATSGAAVAPAFLSRHFDESTTDFHTDIRRGDFIRDRDIDPGCKGSLECYGQVVGWALVTPRKWPAYRILLWDGREGLIFAGDAVLCGYVDCDAWVPVTAANWEGD